MHGGTGGGVAGPVKGGPTDPWEVGYILKIRMFVKSILLI